MRGSRTKALKGQRPVSGKALLGGRSELIILQSILSGYPALAQKQERNSLTYGELLEKIEAGKSPKLIDPAQQTAFN